ncbi:MAG TPA: alpha/beta hydrolase fold domain-containing protein [Sphingobium sp.]|uniref:alpha/beta hydrolase n=1 Tax=Sphingobium sp. TaxID=1912891 RepID=UPI002ED55CCB
MSDTDSTTRKGVLDPERIIPPPSTVSPEAQAFLSQRMPASTQPKGTADKAAWKAYIEQSNGWLTAQMEGSAGHFTATFVTHQLERTPLYEVVPDHIASEDAGRVVFYIHGGAFIHGYGTAGAYMAMPLACTAGLRTFCVDYRMPPDHPFPVGLEDAVAAYAHILERYDPASIAIAGGSAGGGLAGSLILKLRDSGLPMPGACILATPEADLTEAGDTFETNHYADVVLQGRLTDSIALYADGHDLTDPYLSPLFGDFTKGFPPTILTSGTRDAFLSNTVLMHRKLLRAGVEAELHVWEAMPHGGFFGAPEDQEVFQQQASFIRKHLA